MEFNKIDMKVKLSTLWIFVLFNMIYADILGFMKGDFLQEIISGYAGGIELTPGFLLIAALFLEIPIVMVLLSRFLNYKINRWANLIAAPLTIIFIIGGGSTSPHYLFFAAVEVLSLLLIIWLAWKWASPEKITK
jgi:hypothetical protein